MKIGKIYTNNGLQVKYTGVDQAEVKSSVKELWYDVTPKTCTCPDFQIRKRGKGICKHMDVAFYSVKQVTFDKLNFKEGVGIDEAYEELGEEAVNALIRNGEIVKMSKKFYLLNQEK